MNTRFMNSENSRTSKSHLLILKVTVKLDLRSTESIANIRKAFANYSSIDIKVSKTQLSKMIQSGGFLGRLIGPLLNIGLPLIKNVIKPLAKIVLVPLGLTVAASVADTGIHKKS